MGMWFLSTSVACRETYTGTDFITPVLLKIICIFKYFRAREDVPDQAAGVCLLLQASGGV